jgi:hypothetical protein
MKSTLIYTDLVLIGNSRPLVDTSLLANAISSLDSFAILGHRQRHGASITARLTGLVLRERRLDVTVNNASEQRGLIRALGRTQV